MLANLTFVMCIDTPDRQRSRGTSNKASSPSSSSPTDTTRSAHKPSRSVPRKVGLVRHKAASSRVQKVLDSMPAMTSGEYVLVAYFDLQRCDPIL
jgi:hypothetical protein